MPLGVRLSRGFIGVEAFLFDKDGTLLAYDHWWRVMEERARRLSSTLALSPSESTALATFLHGDGGGWGIIHLPRWDAEVATTRYLQENLGLTKPRAETLVKEVFRQVDEEFPFETYLRPTPGARELLETIRQGGGKIALVTHDTAEAAHRHLRGLGWAELVDAVVGLEVCPERKPSPEPVLWACRALGVRPERATMVGDLPADLQAGKAAGCVLTVGVLTGLGTTEDLAPWADLVVPDLAHINLDGA